MADALNVIMRWVHIASVVALIGGILYGRLVMLPGIQSLAEEARESIERTTALAFRPIVLVSTMGLTLSGLYNIFSNPGHSPRYHMVLGVKLLLVMHVFAVGMLVTAPKNPRRARMLSGTVISGLAIILISAYLRRIF
jgi:uncharacterized membrane protein